MLLDFGHLLLPNLFKSVSPNGGSIISGGQTQWLLDRIIVHHNYNHEIRWLNKRSPLGKKITASHCCETWYCPCSATKSSMPCVACEQGHAYFGQVCVPSKGVEGGGGVYVYFLGNEKSIGFQRRPDFVY